jgi:hypothetical protein
MRRRTKPLQTTGIRPTVAAGAGAGRGRAARDTGSDRGRGAARVL